MQRKRIVLLGQQGSGKTALFNNITGHKQPTKSSGQSLTRKIVLGQSQHGIGFEVIDTPGFESDEEKILHAAGIIAGLSYGQLNRIIIVVKSGRDKELEIIKRIYDCVKRFQEYITIYFTFLDSVSETEKDEHKKHLIDYAKEKFNIKSVLFGSKEDKPISIISALDKILETSDFVNVELKEFEWLKTYNFIILENQDKEDEINEFKAKLTTEFNHYVTIFNNFINSLDENEKFYLDILQKLQFFIKEQANKVLEKFEKKFGEYLNNNFQINSQNNQYLHHIMLSYSINQDVLQLISKIYTKMSKNKNSIFKYLKQCPYCDQIWMKVYGCDSVVCGREVGVNNDAILSIDLSPEIEFEYTQGGQLKYKINQRQPINNKSQLEQILEQYFQTQLPQEFKRKYNLESFSDLIKLLKRIIKPDFLDDWNEKLELQYKDDFLQRLTGMLEKLEVVSESNLATNKKLGCGKQFDWVKGKLIKPEKYSELLSEGLLSYFKDHEELQRQELILWQSDYQDLMKGNIQKHIQQIDKLPQIKLSDPEEQKKQQQMLDPEQLKNQQQIFQQLQYQQQINELQKQIQQMNQQPKVQPKKDKSGCPIF